MGADYDRLFQSPEGAEIPDGAGAEPEFDIDSGFEVDVPGPSARMPASPPQPNGHVPPPVDWHHEPQPPARPETPPPPVNYDGLFAATEGIESLDDATELGFDVNSGFDAGAPPMPAGPPPPKGHVPPPMPVDWHHEPRQAARPATPRPPVDWNDQPPPARPKPPPIEAGPPPTPPSQHPRRARPGPREPAEAQRGHPGNPPHPRRANAEQHRAEPPPARRPPRPRLDAARQAPNGGPVQSTPPMPTTKGAAVQPDSRPVPAAGEPPGAVSHIGVKPGKKSATKLVSRRSWRRWFHKLTRINVGLSRDEKYDLALRNRIRRSPRGAYQIAILGLKGGVGKTTVTVALGSMFAQVRRDRILAFDADASCGNLADRAGHQSGATVADLLADKDLTHYNDIRAHTSANAVNLEVLPAEDYSTARRAFSEADWHYAADAVSRFYNLVLADCGAGLFDPVTRGVLSTASAVVIVTSASIDGARQAAVAIDWLRNNGHQDLLSRACVAINNVSPGDTNIAVGELVRQFEQYVQPSRVVALPWDKHIAAGTEIQLSLLDPAYKRKVLELAAALSDDFDRGERR
jgi:MinD-like ATPase involved in chromosome partitioning or flagellar assembly